MLSQALSTSHPIALPAAVSKEWRPSRPRTLDEQFFQAPVRAIAAKEHAFTEGDRRSFDPIWILVAPLKLVPRTVTCVVPSEKTCCGETDASVIGGATSNAFGIVAATVPPASATFAA